MYVGTNYKTEAHVDFKDAKIQETSTGNLELMKFPDKNQEDRSEKNQYVKSWPIGHYHKDLAMW